jgi:SAM-dependent methyltransferase
MSDILPQISENSANFVRGMDGYRIFGNGLRPENYKKEMISADEYVTLQNKLTGHFKFIWSDVTNLHTHLDTTYDVINLSNIFEWNPKLIQPTLQNLHDYIRPGGYILVQTGDIIAISRNTKEYAKASENLKDWAKIGTLAKNNEVVILQRIR